MWTVSMAAALAAQTPRFDVASVKASASGRRGSRIEAPPGSLIMNNVTMLEAVAWAYHVFEYQVTAPGWLGAQRYDISAKADSPVDEIELRKMLQELLAERFRMEIHHQTKEMQAYVMTVAKGGHKLQQADTTGAMDVKPKGMGAVVLRADLDELAAMASKPLQAPVVNATGLTGKWNFTVDATPYLTPEVMANAKSATDLIGLGITAVREQLGIKVESKRVAVDMIVVDRVERVPVEN
jgi:uncharacterized protein (TIGR03435 family)